MDEKDSVYIRLGRRFQRIPADTRGWYLFFINDKLYLSRTCPDQLEPVGIVIDQNGTMLTVAEYEVSGPMTFEEAMRPKVIALGRIKAHRELPSRRELLQMHEQKDKFPEPIKWLWSKEEYSLGSSWALYWYDGFMGYDRNYNRNHVRRVFHISIKSLFV